MQTVFGEVLTLPVDLQSEEVHKYLSSFILDHMFSSKTFLNENGICIVITL